MRKIGDFFGYMNYFRNFAAEKKGKIMADYKKFFKRENFIASMQAAKERKQKWEREVQQKWDELHKEMEPTETKIAL